MTYTQDLDYKVSYWNSNGKYQEFVNAQLDNNKIDTLKITKKLKTEYHKMAHSYYKFFNDGDNPRYKIFRDKGQQEIAYLLEDEMNRIIKIIKSLVE